ncbi:MAG TPA: hypothetical protein VFF49_04805 [Thermodesulfobacteriota bacterium]|nr:hypothetical protein [Thermodesulfobacteriota bacterium]
MVVLSKGYKKPETGDFGDSWFDSLEDNISLSNSHDHDGVDGEKITAINLNPSTLSVSSGSFADQGDGYWRATVTVPSGGLVDSYTVTIKDPTTKDPINLKIAKLNSTQFYLYTNFVQTFEVFFGV